MPQKEEKKNRNTNRKWVFYTIPGAWVCACLFFFQAYSPESYHFGFFSFHSLWGPFDIEGGGPQNDSLSPPCCFLPRWEFFVEGGRHGASMDGPLAFAYHQLPPLILHPPRSNCDATFLAYNTRLIYRETRNIARHIDTHRKERRTDGRTHACQPESYAVTGERSPPPQQQPFFSEQFFNPPDLFSSFLFIAEI